MAIRHGKAGSYPKAKANDLQRKAFVYIIVGGGIMIALFGFLTGLAWSHWGPILASFTATAILGLFLLAIRRFDPLMEDIFKERMWYMRGHEGEALIALKLTVLEDAWHVFHALKLVPESDIDHIVVGPGGVFCISTKARRGVFTVLEPSPRPMGSPRSNWNRWPHSMFQNADQTSALLSHGITRHLSVESCVQ